MDTLARTAADLMTTDPQTIAARALLVDAAPQMVGATCPAFTCSTAPARDVLRASAS